MRYCPELGDPGYAAWKEVMDKGKTIRVFLDGKEQSKFCDLADSLKGIVRVAVLDAEGNLQADPDNPNKILTKILSGKVTFIIEDRPL